MALNTTAKLHIQKATAADVPLIIDLIKQLAIYEKLEEEAKATPAAIETHLFGPKAVAECLLAFAAGECVGFALFFHNFSTFVGKPGIYLEDLFIKEQYRGLGYGKQLLMHLVQTSKERNCGRVEWSVLNWNEPAIQFYKSLGATAMSEWTVYRLDDKAINQLLIN